MHQFTTGTVLSKVRLTFRELMYYRKCNQFVTISCFGDKTGNMYFFPSKIALFHINCYFIGKVSPVYGFLAGLNFPESIFAEKNTYFLFCNQNRKYVIFSQKEEICYFSQNRIISHQLLLHR